MKIKDHVKKLVFGLTIHQQYLCLSRETFSEPLKCTITLPNSSSKISVKHFFVGYKPVVLAFDDERNMLGSRICLHFHHDDLKLNSQWQGFPAGDTVVARMTLALVRGFDRNRSIKLYRADLGEHFFLSGFHQRVNNLRNRFIRNKPGNVNLEGNLHDMVRIAYSLPRTIALMSVENGGLMNLFPTDLHGQVNETFYISSLRIGGKAQQQVETVGKVLLSEVENDSFREVYALGKNHMKEMTALSNFSLRSSTSEKFGFGIPASALRYFELEVLESVDVGIHRIYLYKIVNRVELASESTLAHIHQYYAQWRLDHALETKYLLR